jgi:hypothetical protein
MRTATVLGALPAINARALGGEPQASDPARDHVNLAGKAWHPKAVYHVGRPESEFDRVPDRNSNLVRADHRLRAGVNDTPPPLLTGYLDSESIVRMPGVGACQPYAQAQQHRQGDNRKREAQRQDGTLPGDRFANPFRASPARSPR